MTTKEKELMSSLFSILKGLYCYQKLVDESLTRILIEVPNAQLSRELQLQRDELNKKITDIELGNIQKQIDDIMPE